MEEEEDIMMWKSSPLSESSNSMVSATVGRVMTTLLGTRPKKLHDAISRLDSATRNPPLGVSLEDSLWILHKYVSDSAEGKESLDLVFLPMIEHSLKGKDIKRSNQATILLNWLFQDDVTFLALATNFASILLRKDDHYIALGWCILARGLLEDNIIKEQLEISGTGEKYVAFLKILSSCVKHLLTILCNKSTFQGGCELPTRLSVAAADCVIALTIALTRNDNRRKSSTPDAPNQSINLRQTGASSLMKVKTSSISPEISSRIDMELLLWNLLDDVITLVQRLICWSRKSRYLHAKGLERVLKWLQKTRNHYGCFQADADPQMVKTGTLLFSSCWKHCSVLLHLEDQKFSLYYKESLDHFLSGIQFYADNYADELSEDKDSGTETINFFLTCLLLLLGRCNTKQFESAKAEYGLKISRVLITQLRSVDEDVIDGTVCIIKAVMFGTNSTSSASSLTDTRHMDAIFPSLLTFFDSRDGAAKAAVTLVSEYCAISSDSRCLEEVLDRLAVGNVSQRRNAVDVISELVHMSLNSEADLSHLMWQDISKLLLERLGDEESVISTQASMLLPMIDFSIILPPLVRLVYSSDERVQSSACNALLAVLKGRNKKSDVICLLLDCLSNANGILDHPDTISETSDAGFKLDTEKVLKLIPEWSKSVEDWKSLAGPLVDKMLQEPSNAIMVRFLSYISEYLADTADIVFPRLLSHARRMKEIHSKEGSVALQHSLFDRLCPLLVIRLLPLRVFDDLKSPLVYGELLGQDMMHDYRYFKSRDTEFIVALLLNRAFSRFEYEDVRKLAAELCGRIHHHVLYPIISSLLEDAASSRDVLTIKACLFTICTSLMARGRFSVWHPAILKIREVIETVLSWPSTDRDEVSKAQHGCIDCLALMVCIELQAPEGFRESDKKNSSSDKGNSASRSSVLTYVIHRLTCVTSEKVSSEIFAENLETKATLARSFRLCMANVLISACQKISDSGRKAFAQKIIPQIICSVGVINDSEIRAACVQILFSAVYHLKLFVLPYGTDLLDVSVKSLREGSEKERMAGAKLMASLMASDDSIVRSISTGLLEARKLLSSILATNTSSDLRLVCQKLLLCITSS